ncbi:MAG: LapA family protein [Veillonellaceae bacterium]|nr:LapA family protein [Veillonellaceae bacterium]
MTHVLLIAAAVFAFLVALFALQNSEIVRVGFIGWKFETSLVLVILGSALLGFLTALFLGIIMQIKLRFQLYKAKQQIRLLEQNAVADVVTDVVPEKLPAGMESTGEKTDKALDKTP